MSELIPESRFPNPVSRPRALVIAGTASGVGKTTITLGLLEAFKRRGLAVQAFKVGPDFIDPGFHSLVTGRPSYNLDGWMCGRERVLETFARQAASADLAIIEGVMGCFDGYEGKSDAGSTAEIAKWLGAPVILVADASSIARSAGALVLGFESYEPDLEIAGVIWNRVGGERHAQWLNESLEAGCRALPLGWLPRQDSLSIPERHLGLVTALERGLTKEFLDELSEMIAHHLDLDQLRSLATCRVGAVPPRTRSVTPRARIGVAWDEAFCFYYQENLDLLREAGAELIFWSPLDDRALPQVDGLYMGGGYPEVHARRLAENAAAREAVRRFAEAGKPIYAECGGLMYLTEAIEDLDGVAHPMVGILPATVRMDPRRLTLAYTEVETTAGSPLGPPGTLARGHEFHCSTLDRVSDSVPRVYRLRQKPGGERLEGYQLKSALMSYVHLHFASNPALARRFVEACERHKEDTR